MPENLVKKRVNPKHTSLNGKQLMQKLKQLIENVNQRSSHRKQLEVNEKQRTANL